MILTELDVYADALKKINLNEEVMPIYKGRVLTENVDIYCKIQKLLSCRPMEGCHRFLYDLDVENLDESECTKVNNLYNLGIERGYITDDTPDTPEETSHHLIDQKDLLKYANGEIPETPVNLVVKEPPQPQTSNIAVAESAYTVVYSAMRNGEIKTGETYSNAINTRAAKADVISKLEKAGYQNISILAIEAGDPDMTGCDNTYCKQPETQIDVPDVSDIQSEAEENSPLISALDDEDGNGLKISSANVCDKDAAKITVREADKEDADDETEDDSEEDTSKEDDKKTDKEDKKEEKAEEPDEKLKDTKDDSADSEETSEEPSTDTDKKSDKKELSDQEKTQFKDSYKKAFKAAMLKCQFEDKCFDDLTLEEKVKFFTELDKAWKSKPDPIDFLSDKETEQLEKIVIKK